MSVTTWVLLWAVNFGSTDSGVGTHSTEFFSQRTCEAAKAAIIKDNKDRGMWSGKFLFIVCAEK